MAKYINPVIAVLLLAASLQAQTNLFPPTTVLPSASGPGELRFRESTANGSDAIAFKAPASLAASGVWTWWSVDGAANDCQKTNGSKVLLFGTCIGTLNTLTAATQTFAVGTSGTDFAISSATSTHTFNLPTASASNRGALLSADWTTFNNKEAALTFSAPLVRTVNTISCPTCGGSAEFLDTVFRVKDDADTTKQLAFELTGLTTATTRTLTPQNASYILAGTNISNVFTAAQQINFSTADTQFYISDVGPRLALGNHATYASATVRSRLVMATVPGHYGLAAVGDTWLFTEALNGGTAGDLNLGANGVSQMRFKTGAGDIELRDDITPSANQIYSLGTASAQLYAMNAAYVNAYVGFVPGTNNAVDVGSAPTTIRTIYLGTSLVHGGATRIDSSGNALFNSGMFRGITGINTSATAATVTQPLDVFTDTSTEYMQFTKYNDGANGALIFRSARGSAALPTATLNGNIIGSVVAQGRESAAAWAPVTAGVYFIAGENFSALNNGTYVGFYTTAVGSATTALRWSFATTGALSPAAHNTYPIGASGTRPSKVWTVDLDISGTCTGCSVGSITTLNTLTTATQTFAVGTSGTDFAISSATSTHTFNLPTASASNRGALSSADWTVFNDKESVLTFSAPLSRSVNTVSCPTCVATNIANVFTAIQQINVSSATTYLYISDVAPSIRMGNNATFASRTQSVGLFFATTAGHYGLAAAGDALLLTEGLNGGLAGDLSFGAAVHQMKFKRSGGIEVLDNISLNANQVYSIGDGTNRLYAVNSGFLIAYVGFAAGSNNAVDLGASATTIRTAYLGTSLVHGGVTRIDSSGNAAFNSGTFRGVTGINTSVTAATVDQPLDVFTDTAAEFLRFTKYNDGSNLALIFRSARGSAASPTATIDGSIIGSVVAQGRESAAAWAPVTAGYYLIAGQDFSAGNNGTYAGIYTTAVGSASPALRWSVATTGAFSPGAHNTYPIGASGTRPSKVWTVDLDISGTCTGCGSGSVPTSRLINTTSPLTGGGDLSADRTLACSTCATTDTAQTFTGVKTFAGTIAYNSDDSYDLAASGTIARTLYTRTIEIGRSAAKQGQINFYHNITGGVASIFAGNTTGSVDVVVNRSFYPSSNASFDNGLATLRWDNIHGNNVRIANACTINTGSGAPTGACSTCAIRLRTDGGTGTTLYVCENSVWVAKV